jgi:putative transposase
MTNYRRITIAGGTYFFTQVTHQRYPWLCGNTARTLLRDAITHVRQKYPFTIDALVLLPDHLHCIWTLPPETATMLHGGDLSKPTLQNTEQAP